MAKSPVFMVVGNDVWEHGSRETPSGKGKNPAQTGRPQPHAALAIQVMIESAWNVSYFIVIPSGYLT